MWRCLVWEPVLTINLLFIHRDHIKSYEIYLRVQAQVEEKHALKKVKTQEQLFQVLEKFIQVKV